MPFLYAFMPSTIQLAPSHSSRSSTMPTYSTYFLTHEPINPYMLNVNVPTPSKTNLFTDFLQSWAQNPANPSLLNKPPTPFHLTPQFTQAQQLNEKPTTCMHSYPKPNRKISSHTHSHFRPYEHSRPLSATTKSPPLSATTKNNVPFTTSYSPLNTFTPHMATSNLYLLVLFGHNQK
jgi:hypothetical protein